MARFPAFLLFAMVCLASACGCLSPDSAPSPASPPGTLPATQAAHGPVKFVSLKASSYDPEQLFIKTGTTVTWVNEENRMTRRVVHMPSEATGKILFQSESLSPGQSYRYTFTRPGRYVYADPQIGSGRSPFVEVTE